MWNSLFRNNMGSFGNQQRGYGTYQHGLFNSEAPKQKQDMMGALIGLNISQIIPDKKFAYPKFANKQNDSFKSQSDSFGIHKIGSKLLQHCSQFIYEPKQPENNVLNKTETNHEPTIHQPVDEVSKTEPISIPAKQSAFENLEVKSESFRESMCKNTTDMGKNQSKELTEKPRKTGKTPKKTRMIVLDTEDIDLENYDDSKKVRRYHTRPEVVKTRTETKKLTRKPRNGVPRNKKHQKYYDYYEVDEYSSSDDEDDDEEVALHFSDDFKVVRTERLHLERDGDDLQFVIGPFYDKQGAISFMDSKTPRKDVAVGESSSLNAGFQPNGVDIIKNLAGSPVTITISGGNTPQQRHTASITPVQTFKESSPKKNKKQQLQIKSAKQQQQQSPPVKTTKSAGFNEPKSQYKPCSKCKTSPCAKNSKSCSFNQPDQVICRRNRNPSECSDDFIVFESDGDGYTSCSDDCSTVTESDDDDDSVQFSESPARYRFPKGHKSSKKVTFDTKLCTVHPMIKWSYAYQAARKGPWEMFARDRKRFQNRIQRSEESLKQVLQPQHRLKVFKDRFSTDN